MSNPSGGPGKGQVSAPSLAALLCDLIPEARPHVAQAVAEAFRSVPWTPGAQPRDEPDLASFELTAMDAEIGAEAVDWCCNRYRLVSTCLHVLLTESEKASPQDRAALRQHCGRLIADGLTDDVGFLREPLELLIDEDLETEILDDLMANTELGVRFRLVTATDARGGQYRIPEQITGNQVPGTVTDDVSLLRPIDLWDLPDYFLARVPETAHYFARHFAEAPQDAADTLEWRASGGQASEPAPFLNVVIAGRKLAELAAPGSLVWRFLAPVVSQANAESAEYADLIRRSCGFLDAAIAADTEAGGHLARELPKRLSDTFVTSAAEVCDRNLTALWRVLDERLWSDAVGTG